MAKTFLIEKTNRYGNSYSLRMPLFPVLPWPYRLEPLISGSDEMRSSPDDDDAKGAAKRYLRRRWWASEAYVSSRNFVVIERT